jgi:uncharacterized lipoprotein YbaY
MIVNIKVILRHQVALPEKAVCRVEVRDVTLLDACSITLGSHEAQVSKISGETVLTTLLEVPDSDTPNRDYNVWAHLSLTGEKRILANDYVTTRAYPIAQGASTADMVVELQPVSP